MWPLKTVLLFVSLFSFIFCAGTIPVRADALGLGKLADQEWPTLPEIKQQCGVSDDQISLILLNSIVNKTFDRIKNRFKDPDEVRRYVKETLKNNEKEDTIEIYHLKSLYHVCGDLQKLDACKTLHEIDLTLEQVNILQKVRFVW